MHTVIVGLGFGDEGKGAAVDWICATQDIKAVIRYNGGPQAAHNVVLPDGRHHTFAQLGSGSFHGVPTHLSQYMCVNPHNLMLEAEMFDIMMPGASDVLRNVTVDKRALLVTPYHRAANRSKEDIRGTGRHGSTGQGVGEAKRYEMIWGDDAPRIGDIMDPRALHDKLTRMIIRINDETPLPHGLISVTELIDEYWDMFKSYKLQIVHEDYIDNLLDLGDCVFEGAQGVLLDELYGFFPHVTFSKATSANALEILGNRTKNVIGVTRTYHTRHGAGPFPTENYETDILSLPEPHNGTGVYQGEWRVGALDLTLLDYAVRADGFIDNIMVTHMDTADRERYILATHGYDIFTTPSPFEHNRLSLPTSLDDAHNMTDFFARHHVVPQQYDFMADRDSIVQAIKFATGITPKYFAEGPTFENRYTFSGVAQCANVY